MSAGSRCPACGAPVRPEDFHCGRCELLLNPSAWGSPEEITQPSIVEALLTVPEHTPRRAIPARPVDTPWDAETTLRFTSPIVSASVPRLVAGMDLALEPLPPFEAYVSSFLDGNHTVAEIASVASLGEMEVQAVLRSLLERGIVEVPPAPPAAPSPPTAPPPPATPATPSHGASLAQPRPPPTTPSRGGQGLQGLPPMTPSRGLARGAARSPGVLQRAVELERQGDVDGAIEVLKQGIAGMKHPAPLYNRLALILVSQRKDYVEAEALLRKALALDPSNAVYEQNLVRVLTLAATDSGPVRKKGILSRFTGRK
jgi:hypothetical protein